MVAADLDTRAGREVADLVGGTFRACDVFDLDSNRALVDFAQEHYGGADIAQLNASVADRMRRSSNDFDPARYGRAMGANLDGVVNGTHAVLPALRAHHGGAIVLLRRTRLPRHRRQTTAIAWGAAGVWIGSDGVQHGRGLLRGVAAASPAKHGYALALALAVSNWNCRPRLRPASPRRSGA